MFSTPNRVGDTGLIALLALAIAGPVRADETVFPKKDWEQVAPESEDVDSARLAQAVEYLQAHTGRDGVRELVVIRNGRVIWQGDNAQKVHNVWSCTKSFTSTVLGLLIDDGRCSIETLAAEFVPGLKTHYRDVTLRHLATMTSGYRAVGTQSNSSAETGSPRRLRPRSRPRYPGVPVLTGSIGGATGKTLTGTSGGPMHRPAHSRRKATITTAAS